MWHLFLFLFFSYLVVAFLSEDAKANISGLLLCPTRITDPTNHPRNWKGNDIYTANVKYALCPKAILGVILTESIRWNLKTKTLN